MDTTTPPFFHRGPAPLARLTFFLSLAILLMVLDARFRYAEALRQTAAVFIYPLQRIAMAPMGLLDSAADFFTSQVALKRENDALKSRQLQAAGELLTLDSLRAENAQLRRLFEARQRLPQKSTFAEILYSGRDPFSRKIVIDKGSQQGIQAGQPVVDDVGVIGQVTRVYPLLAEVTLITDKEQVIPVQVVRNGLRAVAYGGGNGGDGTLDLRFMTANADIQTGDVLVTSGIDGTYPPGLPVAKVARIERDAAYAFANISCTPTAGTDQNKQVLVLSQEAVPPPASVQAEPAKPAKTKRARATDR
ncbi:MAG: rod shape-determining protein MreC [Burkholderiales bacterium]